MCTQNGGCPQHQKEAFLAQTNTAIAFDTSRNPPYTICALQSNTQGENGRPKTLLHAHFALGYVSGKNPKNSPFSLLFFLSPLTLKLLYSSIATFRALKRPNVTSERPKMSRRLTYRVATSHCTLGILTLLQ